MFEYLKCHAFTVLDGRFSYPGSTPHYAPDRTFDTRHSRLELILDFARKTLKGQCIVTLQAVADGATEMVFDAVDFKDLKVSSRGKALKFDYIGRKLKIHWPSPVKRGTLVEVCHSLQSDTTQAWTAFYLSRQILSDQARTGLDAGRRRIQPLLVSLSRRAAGTHDDRNDHRSPGEVYTAISNGALLNVRRRGATRTFHWKHNVPHSPYLVSLAVGEFSEIKDKWKHVPVLYYCPPGREEDSKRAFGKTPKMIDFFSRKLGVPYAYAKYSQVAAIDFIYGGMENTSCTTQTALTLHDERAHLDFSSDPLVAHELAHQWFGDLVTCKDWSHAWLNESFATYFEALFKEDDMGPDEFMYELRGNADAYFDEDKERYRRPLSTKFYKNTNDLFDRHLYEKGSCILHMIRKQLGESDWWRSINLYLKRHRGQGVETINLIDAIQDATGKNMRAFFDQWVFKGGHPEYKARTWWDARQKKAYLRVLQTHGVNEETPLHSVPLEFGFLRRRQTAPF